MWEIPKYKCLNKQTEIYIEFGMAILIFDYNTYTHTR